jgi:hypothetical protein
MNPMLYCEPARLVFLHVPKNAGKSVRKAFARCEGLSHDFLASDLGVDEVRAEELMDGEVDVPGLGPVKPAHLPLPIIEAHFPAMWRKIRSSRSFIFVRPPRDRFFSALMQRIGEFGGSVAIRADDPQVRREAEGVCEWLAGREAFSTVEYIHFSRQIDYAELRGKRIVSAAFPLDRLDLAARWVEDETGLRLEFPHEHARREPRRWAGAIQPAARFLGRRLMTPGMKKALYPLWMNSGVFSDAAGRYRAIDLGAEVEGFIAEYYARDARLYADSVQRARIVDQGSAA